MNGGSEGSLHQTLMQQARQSCADHREASRPADESNHTPTMAPTAPSGRAFTELLTWFWWG